MSDDEGNDTPGDENEYILSWLASRRAAGLLGEELGIFRIERKSQEEVSVNLTPEFVQEFRTQRNIFYKNAREIDERSADLRANTRAFHVFRNKRPDLSQKLEISDPLTDQEYGDILVKMTFQMLGNLGLAVTTVPARIAEEDED